MEADVIVNINDVRAAKMCSRGGRDFFSRHGLDWDDFLKNGILSSKLPKDAMALAAIEAAHKRQGAV
jgi:hypothetical protein